ncbi:MAG: hypothetical protein AAGD35_22890, partial [Actinomycetota bacterium]
RSPIAYTPPGAPLPATTLDPADVLRQPPPDQAVLQLGDMFVVDGVLETPHWSAPLHTCQIRMTSNAPVRAVASIRSLAAAFAALMACGLLLLVDDGIVYAVGLGITLLVVAIGLRLDRRPVVRGAVAVTVTVTSGIDHHQVVIPIATADDMDRIHDDLAAIRHAVR